VGKNPPNLKLIKKPAQDLDTSKEELAKSRAQGSAFDFVALDELSAADRESVDRLVSAVAQNSGTIAAARALRPWDLRPVIISAGENGPSIIRLAGPEVALQNKISERLEKLFEVLTNEPTLNSGICDWGRTQGQLYFRRSFAPETLAHILVGETSLDVHSAYELIRSLAQTIAHWHARGLIHGHICSSNIEFSVNGGVTLLDAGIGAALAQVTQEVDAQHARSLAPELSARKDPGYATDVYGLGVVIRRVCLAVKKKYQFSDENSLVRKRLSPFQELASSMLLNDPRRRSSLNDLLALLDGGDARKAANFSDKGTAVSAEGNSSKEDQRTDNYVDFAERKSRQPQRDVGGADPQAAEQFDSFSDYQEKVRKERGIESPTRSAEPEYSGGPDANTIIYKTMSAQRERESQIANSEPIVEGYVSPFDAVEHAEADEVLLDEEDLNLDSPQAEPSAQRGDDSRKSAKKVGIPTPQTEDQNSWSGFLGFVGVLCLVLVGVWFFMKPSSEPLAAIEYTYAELRADWASKMPSRMVNVAEIAVDPEVDNRAVQDMIVASALQGEKLPSMVNVEFLRIAFDDRWERDLTAEDRRMAVSLALASLLRDRMPQDLGPLIDHHPALILAVAASAGQNLNRILDKVPADVLTSLPQPYGDAFAKLTNGQKDVTCADRGIQLLARFGTRGVDPDQIMEIPEFLRGDTSRRLNALAIMFSQHERLAKSLLDVLLNHPNMVLKTPHVTWARAWDILSWNELDSVDRLFVLSGIPPAKMVSAANIVKLFTHPEPSMRSYAIRQAMNRVKFNHPAAFAVLTELEAKPELLDSEQLSRLAAILENPQTATQERIESWLSSAPPTKLIAMMLIGSAKQSTSFALDTWFAVYLKQRAWVPSLEELKELIHHPDEYTRLYSYNLLHLHTDKAEAKSLLEEAMTQETSPDLKAQLSLMMEQFRE
jgi:serine/threonine protein kinase